MPLKTAPQSPRYRGWLYDQINNTLEAVNHQYLPSISAYWTSLTAQVEITFSNFSTSVFYIPIRIAQDSFFNTYKHLNIVDAQFVAISSNEIFSLIQSEENIYNLVLKLST